MDQRSWRGDRAEVAVRPTTERSCRRCDRDQVRGYVHQRLGDRLRRKAESGDFMQDAMLQFQRYSPRFQVESGEQFEALLWRIVENVLRDEHDWFKRKRREMDRECPLPASSVLHLGSSQVNSHPVAAAQQHEAQAMVRLALDLLSASDREIIILREYDGLSYAQIAERLEVKEPAVRVRLSRALNRLGTKMSKLYGNELN